MVKDLADFANVTNAMADVFHDSALLQSGGGDLGTQVVDLPDEARHE